MKEHRQISQDDLQDVVEMTDKIEDFICGVLKENELHLAMSALMSATINCILAQCKTREDMEFYELLFFEIFDRSIKTVETHNTEKPPHSMP